MTTVPAVALFLQFVPLEGEVHDFFKPVTGQILRLLQGKQCLPTEFSPSSIFSAKKDDDSFGLIINTIYRDGDEVTDDQMVEWRQPSQLLRVPNELIRQYIPQSLLNTNLSLAYLNSGLHSAISNELLAQLGIGSITIQHLITVAEQALASFTRHRKTRFRAFENVGIQGSYLEKMEAAEDGRHVDLHILFVHWVAPWLACVYTVMEETRDVSSTTINSLKKIPIVPLTDGSFTSLDKGTLFFHKELNEKGKTIITIAIKGSNHSVEHE